MPHHIAPTHFEWMQTQPAPLATLLANICIVADNWTEYELERKLWDLIKVEKKHYDSLYSVRIFIRMKFTCNTVFFCEHCSSGGWEILMFFDSCDKMLPDIFVTFDIVEAWLTDSVKRWVFQVIVIMWFWF